MKRKLISLALLCMIYGLTLVPITKAQGNFVIEYFTLQADRDCDLHQDDPDTNQLCATPVSQEVMSRNANRNRRVFVHFLPLPTSTEPRNVINASLSLFVLTFLGSGVRSYETSGVNGNWTETGITWNNRPPAGLDLSYTSVTLGSENFWQSFDVSAIVRSWVENSTSDDGISLIDANESSGSTANATVFDSRQGTNKPVLHVNTTGLGNIFVSGMIAFVYVSLLIFMVIGGFFIAMVIKGKKR